jgi:hypothetical protein
VKEPGSRWQAVEVPAATGQRSVGLVETRSGLVVIADGPAGIAAWRSEDGQTWHGPELLPDSPIRHDRPDVAAAQDMIHDEDRDILLVVAYPGRVWRSEAGGPFQQAGPLPVALSDPAANDGVHRGVALADGFLVATSDSPLGVGRTRLQMSSDGATWTLSPPLRASLGESGLLEYDGRLLFSAAART